VQQEAELDAGRPVRVQTGGLGEGDPVGGHALGVLARVRVARLDRVRQRLHGRPVGVAQLQRAVALLLEDLAQIGGVALELALTRGRLPLRALQLLTEVDHGVTGPCCCHLDSRPTNASSSVVGDRTSV
jgi:hypothetical protein